MIVEAKFLRFTITACSSGEPCIDELEVFEAGDDTNNLASAAAGATPHGVHGEIRAPG